MRKAIRLSYARWAAVTGIAAAVVVLSALGAAATAPATARHATTTLERPASTDTISDVSACQPHSR